MALQTETPPLSSEEAAGAASLPTFAIEIHGPYGTYSDAVDWTRERTICYAEHRLLYARPGTTITVFKFSALGEPTAIWSRKVALEPAGLGARTVYLQRVEVGHGRQEAG